MNRRPASPETPVVPVYRVPPSFRAIFRTLRANLMLLRPSELAACEARTAARLLRRLKRPGAQI
eukprot:1644031-Rhodomonas_salina.1